MGCVFPMITISKPPTRNSDQMNIGKTHPTLIEIFNWRIFQLYFPSLAITVHNQIDDYTTNQFVSELGGAAGIVLGVSLYTIVKSEFIKLRWLWVKWVFSNRWSDWFVFCYCCKAAKTFNQDVVWFKNISKTVSLGFRITIKIDYSLNPYGLSFLH